VNEDTTANKPRPLLRLDPLMKKREHPVLNKISYFAHRLFQRTTTTNLPLYITATVPGRFVNFPHNLNSFTICSAIALYCHVLPPTLLNCTPCRLTMGTLTIKISNRISASATVGSN